MNLMLLRREGVWPPSSGPNGSTEVESGIKAQSEPHLVERVPGSLDYRIQLP